MNKADAHILNLLARESANLRGYVETARTELNDVDYAQGVVWAPRFTDVIAAGAKVQILNEIVLATDTTREQRNQAREASHYNMPYFSADPL